MNMPPNLDQRGWEMRVSVTSRLAREAAPSETHVVLARQCGCVDDPDDRRAAVLAFSTRLVEAPQPVCVRAFLLKPHISAFVMA